ncbi:hypothetical protein LP419_22795 [Massilia sp. H-1]|nr:hypothetical protein LP419_22795 [Massilia sp. H-1]
MPEPHLNRMAALLFATSYLQYCSYSNKLRLPLVELQRRQNIDPYLAYVHAMYDSARNFTGFFTAAAPARIRASRRAFLLPRRDGRDGRRL